MFDLLSNILAAASVVPGKDVSKQNQFISAGWWQSDAHSLPITDQPISDDWQIPKVTTYFFCIM